jgi:hypothetical protein
MATGRKYMNPPTDLAAKVLRLGGPREHVYIDDVKICAEDFKHLAFDV